MLTTSELRQIKDYLALYGKKDSQLTTVSVVGNTDYVSIVQNGKNVIISIELLKRAVLEGIITDEEFEDLWDETPTEGSRKAVRSNGIWKDSQDLHSKVEKFVVTLTTNPTNFEITGSTLTSTLTTTNKVEVFGDAGATTVTPSTSSITVTGGSVNNNVWTLPQTAGTYAATYNATYNGISKSASANVSTYLRKYFGFSAEQPSDITTLATSHASSTVNCTITVPTSGIGFKYIWFAVPDNMSITDIRQPDSLNAPLAFTYVGTTTRTIGSTAYTYKLYRSASTIDSSVAKRLTIS